jgi:hypothetical protein
MLETFPRRHAVDRALDLFRIGIAPSSSHTAAR